MVQVVTKLILANMGSNGAAYIYALLNGASGAVLMLCIAVLKPYLFGRHYLGGIRFDFGNHSNWIGHRPILFRCGLRCFRKLFRNLDSLCGFSCYSLHRIVLYPKTEKGIFVGMNMTPPLIGFNLPGRNLCRK